MQSRLESFFEQCLNIGSGFIISLLLWAFVVSPFWGFESNIQDTLGITAVFTVVSVIRGYLWRRYFNFRAILRGVRGEA